MASEGGDVSIISGNSVDLDKMKGLQERDYDELKALLGVKGEFCIYFEDTSGNLINLSDLTGEGNSVGLGNSNINVSEGVSCTKV